MAVIVKQVEAFATIQWRGVKPVPTTEKSVVVLIYLGLLGCFDEDLLHLLDGCSPAPPLARVLVKENIEKY
jgi:hypothetical protein